MGTRARRPRARRTAEEARRLILDAAEKRLREGGPEAIRLQDIAADVGISHPAILHHFESRDGLVEALALRAMDKLEAHLVTALEGPATGATALEVIERVLEALGDAGHARLLAWRALSLDTPSEEHSDNRMLRNLTDRIHARRLEFAAEQGWAPPPRQDSEYVVRLAAAAMIGDSICGPMFSLSAGRKNDAKVQRRFRAWFASLLAGYLGIEPE